MASYQSKFKRCLLLLLALVVLITCLLVLPVSAADEYTVSGVWVFNNSLTLPSTNMGSIAVNFTSNGISYNSMLVLASLLNYIGDSSGLAEYSSSAWAADAYRTVDFGTETQTVSETFYTWFTANAVQQTEEETFYVGSYWTFEADLTNCPEFHLEIPGTTFDETTSFSDLTFDRYSLVFDLDGASPVTAWTLADGWVLEQFKQICFTGEYEISLDVYTSFCSAAYQNRDCSGDVPYLTTVTIDGTGYHFFDYLAFSEGYPTSPDVTLEVNSSGCTMTYGDVIKTWTYSGSGTFQGFSTTSGGDVLWEVGSTSTMTGLDGDDATFALYPVDGISGETGDALTATFVCGDQSYVFTGAADALPEVTLTVNAGGFTLSDGVTSYHYTSDTGVIGYKLDSDADAYIAVGETYIFRSDFNSTSYTQPLYPFYSDDATFVSTINIWNSDGTKLLASYASFATGAAPTFTLTVQSNGCTLVAGTDSYTWSADGNAFYGFSLSRYTASAYYSPGNVYSLPGGDVSNMTWDLYVQDEAYSSMPPAVDFVGWLKDAVGSFMDFEIWPGLSLNKITYFILVVHIVLWFLRVIS